MPKDYWDIAKNNFRILAIVSTVLTVLYILNFLQFRQPILLIGAAMCLIDTVVRFVLTSLFKKKSRKAITVGYTYLALAFTLNLVNYLILNSPADFFKQGILFKILGLLILVYLFNNVYKASKQEITQPQTNPSAQ
jgi:hypothetical protein